VFEQVDAQHVAAIWFGFDAAGNQAWLSGIGEQGIDGYAGIFYQPIAPRFGSAYDPAAFNPQQRGMLSGLKANCLAASGTVTGFPGLPDNPLPFELALTRFTSPAGIAKCSP